MNALQMLNYDIWRYKLVAPPISIIEFILSKSIVNRISNACLSKTIRQLASALKTR